jgi:hypothetical protein
LKDEHGADNPTTAEKESEGGDFFERKSRKFQPRFRVWSDAHERTPNPFRWTDEDGLFVVFHNDLRIPSSKLLIGYTLVWIVKRKLASHSVTEFGCYGRGRHRDGTINIRPWVLLHRGKHDITIL